MYAFDTLLQASPTVASCVRYMNALSGWSPIWDTTALCGVLQYPQPWQSRPPLYGFRTRRSRHRLNFAEPPEHVELTHVYPCTSTLGDLVLLWSHPHRLWRFAIFWPLTKRPHASPSMPSANRRSGTLRSHHGVAPRGWAGSGEALVSLQSQRRCGLRRWTFSVRSGIADHYLCTDMKSFPVYPATHDATPAVFRHFHTASTTITIQLSTTLRCRPVRTGDAAHCVHCPRGKVFVPVYNWSLY